MLICKSEDAHMSPPHSKHANTNYTYCTYCVYVAVLWSGMFQRNGQLGLAILPACDERTPPELDFP